MRKKSIKFSFQLITCLAPVPFDEGHQGRGPHLCVNVLAAPVCDRLPVGDELAGVHRLHRLAPRGAFCLGLGEVLDAVGALRVLAVHLRVRSLKSTCQDVVRTP